MKLKLNKKNKYKYKNKYKSFLKCIKLFSCNNKFIIFLLLLTNFIFINNFIELSDNNEIKINHKYIIINKTNESKKNSKYIKNKAIEMKIKYYENFLTDIPNYLHTHIYSNNIYWCWLQGINNAPDLYKAAFNSIKNKCTNHNIIIINKTNLFDYVKFPDYILEKYQKKIIDNTHFSDLLRLELLIKYGGTWIDASVLVTKYNEIFFKKDLFFFRTNWFITSEKENPVLKTTRDLLYEYWRKENYLCHYFIFHLLFNFAYNKYISDYLQMPNFSNIPVHYMQKQLTYRFNITLFTNILNEASIHKLTNKFSKSKDSFYFYIINKYNKIDKH